MAKVAPVATLAELENLCGAQQAVAYFRADFVDPCRQTDQLCTVLAEQCSNLVFAKIDAESAEDKAKVEMIVGANAPEITSRITQFNSQAPQKVCGSGGCGKGACASGGCASKSGPSAASNAAPAPKTQSDSLNARLEKLLKRAPVMLFMKGLPGQEKCGFSRQIVTMLQENGVKFDSFDILSDEEVRQGLKTYSNWPTYPQLYSNGKLIGGLDILKELVENGELKDALGVSSAEPETLDTRLSKLINRAPVMLFMKGSPGQEKCGFSRQIVTILKDNGVKFDSFDILSDEEVRQGLKTYSNWPTYPQLYSNGKLLGGLDILKEMVENGELKEALGA